ncbi:MAG: hypothetical protein U1E49_01215 [Hyphomicrobiaceae bacterium]
MSWSIELSPLVPMNLLIAAAIVAAVLGLVLMFRRSRGAVLRILSLAALLAALANPTLRQEERQGLSNIAVVVVDRSMSQTLAERQERTNAARAALAAELSKIKNLDTRYVEVTDRDGTGKDGTKLFGELTRALSGVPPERLAGIVMLTDGQVHDAPKSIRELGIDAPVHALLTGAEGEFDRRIAVLKAPRYGLVGSEAVADLKIEEQGAGRAAGTPAEITIRREAEPDITQTVTVGETFQVPITFPHSGPNIVEIELKPIAGELTEANNRMVLSVEGVRENLRVLLVSGEPHAGERTWRNLLKSDAAVDLVHFTILRPPHKQDGTPINELSLIAFPTRELFQEKLEEFDLIIFDRYERLGILPPIYIDNIARYVEEKGGAVLIAAGEEYASPGSIYNTPLAQVLPAAPTGEVVEEAYKPRLTDLGERHPVTQGLEGASKTDPKWGRWFRLVSVEAPSGETLMQGPGDRPLLILDRKGKGRIALMLSDHAWLWARGLEGGGPHTALLRRMAHWLMKEPELEEERLSTKTAGLKVTIERRSMQDTVPPVTLQASDGSTIEVQPLPVPGAPGLFRAETMVKEPGFYKAVSGELSAVALAGAANNREMAEVVTTADKLQPVADSSGGGVYFTASAPGASPASPSLPRISMLKSARLLHGSGWMGLKDREAHLTTGITLYPLFTGFAALAGLLGLISLAWWREGR